VNQKNLWAPWRLAYVKSDKTIAPPDREIAWLPGADRQCFVCKAVADSEDRENLVVYRGPRTITILNRYPYNNGHLLVAPLTHRARLDQLNGDELAAIMDTITAMVGRLEKLISPEGFNIGLNLGRVAGAGLPGHLHWHIVPRWFGDTSFMPVVGSIDVIPQSLDVLWEMFASAETRA
jgi:ATP adenylyltransferase